MYPPPPGPIPRAQVFFGVARYGDPPGGAPADVDHERGDRHDAAVYASDEQLVAVAVPFAAEGVAAGDPVVLVLPPPEARAVVAALPGGLDGITLASHAELYQRPALSILALQRLVSSLRADGSGPVRLIAATPLPSSGSSWQPWARFESHLTSALAGTGSWVLCVFDRRQASAEVLADLERTHPHLVDAADGRRPSPNYEERASFLHADLRRDRPPDPGPPDVTLTDVAPIEVRREVARAAGQTSLSLDDRHDLVTAASEVTTNAVLHGAPPVVVRIWSAPHSVTVEVHDRGPGPDDPTVGLTWAEREPGAGGMGLWLAHRLCSEVTMRVDPDGFAVRLTSRASAGVS